MQKGTIVRLMDGKGYGFIKREDGDKDLFFHANSLENVDFNSLKLEDEVEFEIEESDKGQNAVNVSRI